MKKLLLFIALFGMNHAYAAQQNPDEERPEYQEIRFGAALGAKVADRGFQAVKKQFAKKDFVLFISEHAAEFLEYQQRYFEHKEKADAFAESMGDMQVALAIETAMEQPGIPEFTRPIFEEQFQQQRPMMTGLVRDAWKASSVGFRIAQFKKEHPNASETEFDAFVNEQMQLLQNGANNNDESSSSDSE